METLEIILTGVLAGLIGALVMNLFLRWVSSSLVEPVNMVEALGSLLTGSLDNAVRVGTFVHLTVGALFGLIYIIILHQIEALRLPAVIFTGFGFGFVHGLIISYILMFFVSERHPIQKYQQASFSIGVLHLIAHVIYGGVVGLIAAVTILILA